MVLSIGSIRTARLEHVCPRVSEKRRAKSKIEMEMTVAIGRIFSTQLWQLTSARYKGIIATSDNREPHMTYKLPLKSLQLLQY